MNEKPQAQPTVIPVQLSSGVYPDDHGNWRVVVWIGGIRNEVEAHRISGWLNGMLQANFTKDPPPSPPADRDMIRQ
jgi:hypothetical protein